MMEPGIRSLPYAKRLTVRDSLVGWAMDEISERLIQLDSGKFHSAENDLAAAADKIGRSTNVEAVIKQELALLGIPHDLASLSEAGFLIGFVIGQISRDDAAAVPTFFSVFAQREPGDVTAAFFQDPCSVVAGMHGARVNRLARTAQCGIFEIYLELVELWHKDNPLAAGPPEAVTREKWLLACAAAMMIADIFRSFVA